MQSGAWKADRVSEVLKQENWFQAEEKRGTISLPFDELKELSIIQKGWNIGDI